MYVCDYIVQTLTLIGM